MFVAKVPPASNEELLKDISDEDLERELNRRKTVRENARRKTEEEQQQAEEKKRQEAIGVCDICHEKMSVEEVSTGPPWQNNYYERQFCPNRHDAKHKKAQEDAEHAQGVKNRDASQERCPVCQQGELPEKVCDSWRPGVCTIMHLCTPNYRTPSQQTLHAKEDTARAQKVTRAEGRGQHICPVCLQLLHKKGYCDGEKRSDEQKKAHQQQILENNAHKLKDQESAHRCPKCQHAMTAFEVRHQGEWGTEYKCDPAKRTPLEQANHLADDTVRPNDWEYQRQQAEQQARTAPNICQWCEQPLTNNICCESTRTTAQTQKHTMHSTRLSESRATIFALNRH